MDGIFSAGCYNINLSKTAKIMGILNITPDSFSDGGICFKPENAVKRAFEIQDLGADILDIGGQSTRPGFKKVCASEEWGRIAPVLSKINGKLNIPVSVDTFYPQVAHKALSLGASIINDVTGFENPQMWEAVSESNCGIVVTHNLPGMNIKKFFENKLMEAEKYGISRGRICFDPGIGFSKTRAEDKFIINNIENLKIKGNALLLGVSRKRTVSEVCEPGNNYEKLFTTTAAQVIGISNGANIIRVHDIREAVLAAQMCADILSCKSLNSY